MKQIRVSPAPMSARHVILTIEEGDQYREREGEITSIWLEWPALRHQISRDTLCLHTTGELDIAKQTADPVERAKNSNKAHEVSEHSRRVFSHIHVRQHGKCARHRNAPQGSALCRSATENTRRLLVVGEPEQGPQPFELGQGLL